MNTPWLRERWLRLTAQLEAARVPHALLISGPAGLGKRGLARAFVARVLCRQAHGDEPACGRCRACEQHAAGNHPDFKHVTFELNNEGKLRSEIAVDQIRALSARFAMTPQFGGYQIALIEPAEAMNRNAANALLKTLEEPSADTLIVLVADQPAHLPATIVSRCARIEVPFPPRAEALAWLGTQGVDRERAETALAFAAGNPGEALEYAGAQARVEEVVRACAELLSGRATASALAARWADEHAGLRLRLLAQCLRLLARHLESGAALPAGSLRDAARLLPGYEFPKLWQAWERVNRAADEIPGPLRTDLSLLAALSGVRDLAVVTA